MGQKDLPLAPGKDHVRAFGRVGWSVARIRGSHHILEKDGSESILTVPCHNSDMSRKLLAGLIKDAGMTEQEYIDAFKG